MALAVLRSSGPNQLPLLDGSVSHPKRCNLATKLPPVARGQTSRLDKCRPSALIGNGIMYFVAADSTFGDSDWLTVAAVP